MSTQPLNLGYAFAAPDTVLVTVDDSHPVENTLTLVVTNRSGTAVQFQNPQGLTPGSQLPAWDDTASPLGRVSVWFPWGDASGDLARVGDATRITCSSRVADWAASDRMTDPRLGVYWILFPLSKSVFLGQDQSISFEFAGIVSHTGTGGRLPEQSWMSALPRVTGYTSQQGQVPVWKNELSAELTAPDSAVPGDQLELNWTSAGASYCSISPGDFTDLDVSGKVHPTMPSEPSVTYTLTAHPASGRPVTDAKTVKAQTGWIDLGPCPAFSMLDGVDAYRVGSEYLALHTGPDGVWASPDARSWSKRESLPKLENAFGATDGTSRLWVMGFARPNGVVASTTDGRSWDIRKDAPWGHTQAAAAAFYQGSIWVIGDDRSLWHSADGGASWQTAPPAPWAASAFLDPDGVAVFAGRMWIVLDGHELWASANGRDWSRQQATPWGDRQRVVMLTATDRTLYGMGDDPYANKNVCWRMDRDQAWSQVEVTRDLSYGIGPAIAPYGSGLLAVGSRAFRWVAPPGAHA